MNPLHSMFAPGRYTFPSVTRAVTVRREMYVERTRLRREGRCPSAVANLVFSIEGTTIVVRDKLTTNGVQADIVRAVAEATNK